MTSKINKETKDKKYPYTKQLLKIAIEQGYINKEIAVKAGLKETSIAQVSAWRNGKTLASERQMRFFINEFGHLLKRKMEHLFYRAEMTPDGQIKPDYYLLNGEMILKHTIKRMENKKNIPLLRLFVLKNNNLFYVVFQKRIKTNLNTSYRQEYIVHSSNEEANWTCYDIQKTTDYLELIKIIDLYSASLTNGNNPIESKNFINDALTLPFIIRQALLKQGYKAEDIVDPLSQNEG